MGSAYRMTLFITDQTGKFLFLPAWDKKYFSFASGKAEP
jgi:hypothetical protein